MKGKQINYCKNTHIKLKQKHSAWSEYKMYLTHQTH